MLFLLVGVLKSFHRCPWPASQWGSGWTSWVHPLCTGHSNYPCPHTTCLWPHDHLRLDENFHISLFCAWSSRHLCRGPRILPLKSSSIPHGTSQQFASLFPRMQWCPDCSQYACWTCEYQTMCFCLPPPCVKRVFTQCKQNGKQWKLSSSFVSIQMRRPSKQNTRRQNHILKLLKFFHLNTHMHTQTLTCKLTHVSHVHTQTRHSPYCSIITPHPESWCGGGSACWWDQTVLVGAINTSVDVDPHGHCTPLWSTHVGSGDAGISHKPKVHPVTTTISQNWVVHLERNTNFIHWHCGCFFRTQLSETSIEKRIQYGSLTIPSATIVASSCNTIPSSVSNVQWREMFTSAGNGGLSVK